MDLRSPRTPSRGPAVCLHRAPAGVRPRRHRGRRRRILRRAAERPGLAHHAGGELHRVPACLGLRRQRLRPRPVLLSQHAPAGAAGDSLANPNAVVVGGSHMKRLLAPVVVAVALVLAACGTAGTPSTTSTTAGGVTKIKL